MVDVEGTEVVVDEAEEEGGNDRKLVSPKTASWVGFMMHSKGVKAQQQGRIGHGKVKSTMILDLLAWCSVSICT
jgi:hypothetical protein